MTANVRHLRALLPKELVEQLRRRAAVENTTVNHLIESAVRAELKAAGRPTRTGCGAAARAHRSRTFPV